MAELVKSRTPRKQKASRKEPQGKKIEASTQADLSSRISTILLRVEEALSGGEIRASVSDYIRLLQMQRECEQQEPKNVEVQWVEPSESTASDE